MSIKTGGAVNRGDTRERANVLVVGSPEFCYCYTSPLMVLTRISWMLVNLIKTKLDYIARLQLGRYIELMHVLVERNLKRRYRGSLLGIYWSLLNPLIMTGLYTAIFGATFSSYYGNSTIDYILAAFTGLIIIHFFSASTSQALVSIVENGGLLNKIQLPMSIFPLSIVAANIFQFGVGSFPLLLLATTITSRSLLNPLILLLPLISLTLICSGIGLLVSSLYVFFRDLSYFYEIICFILWITSPVFYPAEIVPPSVKPFLLVNPLLPIIESTRQIALSGNAPDLTLVFHSLINGILTLAVGIVCFRWLRSEFIDLL